MSTKNAEWNSGRGRNGISGYVNHADARATERESMRAMISRATAGPSTARLAIEFAGMCGLVFAVVWYFA